MVQASWRRMLLQGGAAVLGMEVAAADETKGSSIERCPKIECHTEVSTKL